MDTVRDVLIWIANNVFGQVAVLIGLITLLGLVLQGKRIEDIVGGALRATLGIIILFVGVDLFTGGLSSFQTIVSSAVGLEPPSSDNTLDDFLASHGGTVALIITLGFALHVVLVRVFRAARYVYLTGHLMFWISVVITACLVEAFGDLSQPVLVVVGAVLIACYWTLQPLWMRPFMRRVTGRDDFGFGHTTSSLGLLTALVARPFGDPERHSTENLKLPRQLSFFKDVNVSTALVIGVILLVAMAFADDRVVAEAAAAYDPDIDPWAWGVIAALRFAGGIAILLYGVRMFLAEIVPAFKGIGDKAVPGTKPALDIPTLFPFAPTAVMLGFVASTGTFLVLLGVFAGLGWFTLVPPMIMLFFGGGAGGVFGNAVAGWRGALIGGVLNGVLLAVGQAVTWGMLGTTAPELATLADPDWYFIAWLLIGVGAVVPGVWPIPIAVAAVTVGLLTWLSVREGRREREERERAEREAESAEPAEAGGTADAATAPGAAATDTAAPAGSEEPPRG
ncbi:PTS ascorbate transporter subunit IIC [Streptomonospora nanhaiensis]|uniref:Ascorbate-specific PTS system EIIC component n=1 Tax=Streptomonospora nanhaiensis TaxID=1323731 RepID=A0A853BJ48_9ACTN|nr:PTS ascorbate transporter subunit IIC [Streptomonospora nanhaiensis]MBV2362929.1 PTS ascorbate transporter subunit IIC [Streptomonospora nanhaiensis]MBX9391540.1 PTS ascorbate transporter subunit IIC [Streptomonospora nanhaiensis]NYI95293.1 PTS system ascorbate-specific IIC component [Streptomonospora nanhaiensis]